MFVAFFSLLILSLACIAGVLYQTLGARHDKTRHPPPGSLFHAGGTRLHVYQADASQPYPSGAPAPTVVFEAGIAGSLLSWGNVQPAVACFAKTASYDRAGLGWSDPPARGRTVAHMCEELHQALAQSGATAPYLLVGHSFGGLLVRAYAERWPEQVAGLLLVDPVGIASWAAADGAQKRRLQRAVALARRGAWLASFGIVRGALTILITGRRRLPQLIGRVAARDGESVLERLVGEVQLLPPEAAPAIRSHWSAPKAFRAMAQYLECLPAAAQEAALCQLSSEIPITILSAGTSTAAEREERDRWVRESQCGRHLLIHESGHWIQIRKPEAVIDAVRQLLTGLPSHSDLR